MSDLLNVLLIGIAVMFVVVVLVFLFVILFSVAKAFCIKRLEYKRYFSKEGAFEGEQIYLIEELTNHSFLPMFEVNVESHVVTDVKLEGCVSRDDVNQHFISSFYVKPFTKIKRMHKVICLKRGYYKLETAQISYGDEDYYLDSEAELYVYPKEINPEIDSRINMFLKHGLPSKMPLLEDVFERSGIRQYIHGDAMNKINHKATARMGMLMVNNHEFVLGKKIKIYNNFHMPGDRYQDLEEFKDIMELAMSFTSYLACECGLKGHVFSYSGNSKTIDGRKYVRTKEGTGATSYMELLRELAVSRIATDFSFTALMELDICENITASKSK